MLKLRKLRAVFYRTTVGREPVREWLKGLPLEERKIIGGDIDSVQWEWPVGRPLVGHLRNGLWEVRSSLENRIARVLFAIAGEDLELAERRWKTWQGQTQAEQDE
jgi:phage-related protein